MRSFAIDTIPCDGRHGPNSLHQETLRLSTWFGGRVRKPSLSRATRGSSGKGKPRLASFSAGITSSRALPTSSAGYWSPSLSCVSSTTSASEAKFSFGGDFLPEIPTVHISADVEYDLTLLKSSRRAVCMETWSGADVLVPALRREHESLAVRNWPHMRLMRKILLWCAGAVALWLAACAVAAVVAIEPSLHPGRRLLTADLVARATELAASDHAALQAVTITASDGAILRAWEIRPDHGNGDAVIVLHGQGDNRVGMLGPAGLLLRHGFQVLLPDARAHGASDGDLATYGVIEPGDIRRWFDWLRQTQEPHCIDALGNSMGAAILLESLKTERGFCAAGCRIPVCELSRSLLRPHRPVVFDRSVAGAHPFAPHGRIRLCLCAPQVRC